MKTVVAAVTYDGNKEAERTQILAALTEWRQQGYDVFVSDGGSSETFLRQSRDLEVHVLARGTSDIGTGIKQAIGAAVDSGADTVIYTEGDKSEQFGNYGFQSKVGGALSLVERGTDIVIIGRTSQSMQTYPAFQRFTEQTLINDPYSAVLRKHADADVRDFGYGPKVISAKAAHEHFLKTPYRNCAASFDPLVTAALAKVPIAEHTVDIRFPAGEEFGDKNFMGYRIEQALQIFEPVASRLRRADPDFLFEISRPWGENLAKAAQSALADKA